MANTDNLRLASFGAGVGVGFRDGFRSSWDAIQVSHGIGGLILNHLPSLYARHSRI